ncbi:MAG: lytic transglycosylase domain-containing protein [Deltaproteobacteria bacterium]|nr:lytic transglycosylase domain-containing protein [Deltaproteobacteria bacterium]
MTKVIGCLMVVTLFVLSPVAGWADIYTYVDENGVIHFSNAPTSPLYRFKMKEGHFDYKRLSLGVYDGLINNLSLRYGVNPVLVKAIIKAESDFDPVAVSTDGAMGLMQLMPQTAVDMGVGNVFNPLENIEGGVRYLKKLMGMFKNNLPLVIAAYNAGEKSVLKYKAVPPYKETQEYVKKVLNYLRLYEGRKGVDFNLARR